MRRAGKIWTAIVLLFLYAPMIVLFVGSFNDGRDLSEFEGFTFDNYLDFFADSDSLRLLANSLILAVRARLSPRCSARWPRSASTPCAGKCAARS